MSYLLDENSFTCTQVTAGMYLRLEGPPAEPCRVPEPYSQQSKLSAGLKGACAQKTHYSGHGRAGGQ